VITRDLRSAIDHAVAAAGFDRPSDPGLRPTGIPGQYAASVALTLGARPRVTAAAVAATLRSADWIATAEVTGPGYLTITVTPAALAAVADTVTAAGPASVTSDALAGETVPAAPPGDPLTAPTWEKARAALAAQLTARLAAAAGATVAEWAATERNRPTLPAHPPSPDSTEVAAAVSFAGRDAVTFALARAAPGKPVVIDPQIIARRVVGNPAYAVRYAHARAASGVRWAVISRGGNPSTPSPETAARPCPPADPGELALLDALSWLPERVATAARRSRPDEFARYLEDLANVTVDVLSSARSPGSAPIGARAPGSDRLSLARAARAGLAAGLGLLGVVAPERLLAEIYREPSCEPCRPPGWATSWGRAAGRSPADAARRP
jgi:arginyl-tRNA synthetase